MMTKENTQQHAKPNKNEEVLIQGDLLTLSTGRKPWVKNIGLESIGVDTNELTNGVEVDDNLETNVKVVHAAGDCAGKKNLHNMQVIRVQQQLETCYCHLMMLLEN